MRVLWPFFVICLSLPLLGQDLVLPPLTAPVQDNANVLSPKFIQTYSALFRKIFNENGPQIQIVTVKDLQDHPIESFTILLAEKWKIGRQGKNDGVIFLIAPKERQVRIEVGADLEGDLTDFETHRIIQNDILPYFKQGNYSAGVARGTHGILQELKLAAYLKGQSYITPRSQDRPKPITLAPLLILLFIFPLLRAFFKYRLLAALSSGGILSAIYYFFLSYAGGVAISIFFFSFIITLLGPVNTFLLLAGRGGGLGRGGGGFGGGGWSGGGGGFSGGGASGRW